MAAAHIFGAVITHESQPQSPLSDGGEGGELPALAAPQRAVPRTYAGAPHQVVSFELEHASRPGPNRTDSSKSGVSWPIFSEAEQSQGQSRASSQPQSRVQSRVQSRAPSPVREVEVLQGLWEPYMNRFRFLAGCFMNFVNGLNDAAPGALIPYMEKYYDIGYALVSLIFVGNALGFITAALFTDWLRHHLGRARTLAVSQSMMALGYIPVVVTAPFPVIVCAFFLIGFGMSINIAMSNTFCGSLRNGTTMLGGLHGSYGVGGTIGPLIATALVTRAKTLWSRYYFLTLGLVVFTAAFSTWSFWGYETDVAQTLPLVAVGDSQAVGSGSNAESKNKIAGMFKAFKSRVVVLGAVFIFSYQGAEVSISGWVISFLISWRHGNPSSVGYVTSGFWAGITFGRFLLTAPAHRIGEKAFVYAVVVGSAVFELLVWLVPNVVGDAISVAIVGLLLGPVYPCAAAVFMRSMSRSEQLSGLTVISAFGSSGGAAAPFTTGLLAQAAGTFVLHPIAIGLFGLMIVCWYKLPTPGKRSE